MTPFPDHPMAREIPMAGGLIDRAAHLRDDPPALARRLREGGRVLPVWRGKPLMGPVQEGRRPLVPLAPDHPLLAPAAEAPLFLGLSGPSGATALFAADLSAWRPEGDLSAVGNFTDASEQSHPALPPGTGFAELRRNLPLLSPADAELAAMAVGLFSWHRFHRFCASCGAPAPIAAAGWRRDCGRCGRQHFPRTDPVVIVLVTHGNELLIGRSHGWPEGMYSLLAGFVEPGETPEAAARREVLEETGIRLGAVTYLASQPWPFPSSLMLGMRARALDRRIVVDTTEIEDARWVSREALLAEWSGGRGGLVAARPGAIAHFLIRAWLSDTLD